MNGAFTFGFRCLQFNSFVHMRRFFMMCKGPLRTKQAFTIWTFVFPAHVHIFMKTILAIPPGCLVHWNFSLKYTDFWWLDRLAFQVALNSHFGHWNVCPICLECWCFAMSHLWLVWYTHSGHLNCLSICTYFWWIIRAFSQLALYAHSGHWNLKSKCIACWCLTMSPL